jgi:uncharacterized membrane protein
MMAYEQRSLGNAHRSATLAGISFESTFRAREFLLAAGGLAASGMMKIKDAVPVVKDDAGKTVVHETIKLVYANLDDATIDRPKTALAGHESPVAIAAWLTPIVRA